MERRKFIKNTLGIGVFSLPGIDNLCGPLSAGEKAPYASALTGDIQKIIDRGDILRSHPPGTTDPWVLLYQGNGRLGSCFGPWGLHIAPGSKNGLSCTWRHTSLPL